MRIHTLWVADHIAFSTVRHTHDYYQLIYCRKSGGSIEIDGTVYDAVPGYFYFVHPCVPHSMERGQNMRLVELKFLAQDKETIRLLKQIPGVFTMEDDFSMRLSLKDILKEGLCNELYSNDSTNAALELLLIRILRTFIVGSEEPLETFGLSLKRKHERVSESLFDVKFQKVVDYIEQNLDRPITLDELAAQVHFNKSYLVERFKEAWGIPPMKYVNWMRIEKAR